ncbi:MAG: hypothetical protein HY901_36405 [Deltaproteobacteria bacterium]|nr:hypothetical protein [Deltaproteobacteria bacterium]
MSSGARELQKSSTYATQFKAAADNDSTFQNDTPADCPARGSIAIVDFQQAEAAVDTQRTWPSTTDIDGLPLWQRIEKMGQAAEFDVRIFLNDEINATNFAGTLKSYTYVILNGHGARPGPKQFKRTGGKVLLSIITPEVWDDEKRLEDGTRYEDAWKQGLLLRGLEGSGKDKVRWTPLLFKRVYRPATQQAWILNECWALLSFNYGLVEGDDGWTFNLDVNGEVENFGHALREVGVPAVLGYVFPAVGDAIADNLLAFLRRQFGAYFDKDVPPSRFPQQFWPTCMSVETFFRLKATPELSAHAPKQQGWSVFTGYIQSDPVFLRAECQGSPAIPHNMMQDFVLSVGTPATAFVDCWNQYWSKGQDPAPTTAPLCSKGEPQASEQAAHFAGCAVKVARKVSNAMMSVP